MTQLAQALAPDNEKAPAGQGPVAAERPAVAQYDPATQLAHAEALAVAWKVPMAHILQFDAPELA